MRDVIIIISSLIVGAGIVLVMAPAEGISAHRFIALQDQIRAVESPPKYRELWEVTRNLAHRVKFLEEQAGIKS